jgi:hypothetical protein
MTLAQRPAPTPFASGDSSRRSGLRAELAEMFRGPSWPLAALLVLYPLWWVLGLAGFAWMILAVPMIRTLRRRGHVRWPPWFAVWAAFLGIVALGVLTVGVEAPDTLAVTGGFERYLVWGLRLVNYVAVTVVLIYAGNLSEIELPRMRLVRMLGVLFVTTVAGGVVGMLVPHLEFATPVERLLSSGPVDALVPGPSLAKNYFVQQLTHLSVAQSQDILGAPRPSAPFEFANSWGNNYAVLIGWFVLAFVMAGSRRTRWTSFVILAISVVPVIYSQNRGMWIGLALLVPYLVVRLALLGRYRIALICAGSAVALGVFVAVVPALGGVITNRIATPHSDEIRSSLARQSIQAGLHSPVVGYGTTRNTIGSERSATIGSTVDCPKCGNRVIGSTGQLWFMLISHGIVGAALYVIFFGQAIVRYWRDSTWLGIVGVQAILLTLFFSLFYSALVSPLAIAMLSLAVLWRGASARQEASVG